MDMYNILIVLIIKEDHNIKDWLVYSHAPKVAAQNMMPCLHLPYSQGRQ